jgi:uncharacterized protein DUF1206
MGAMRSAAQDARRSPVLRGAARAGLVARGLFYAVLTYLVVRVAASGGHSGHQADPGGAFHLIASSIIGKIALVAAAAGFAAFAVTRLVVAVLAATGDREWWPATRAVCETIAYSAFCAFAIAVLLGNRTTGTNQGQQSTAKGLLDNPAGPVLVTALGVAVIGFYGYQLFVAFTRGFESSLDEKRMPRWLLNVSRAAGSTGIVARAIAFVPAAGFLIYAAVTEDAKHSRGIDGALRDVAGHPWGTALLALVALGLGAFAIYSGIEAAYRRVARP